MRVVVARNVSVSHITQLGSASHKEPPEFGGVVRSLRSPGAESVGVAPRGAGQGQVPVPFQSHSVPAVHAAYLPGSCLSLYWISIVQFEGINTWVSNMFNMGQYVRWLSRRLPYCSATRTQVRQRISKADTIALQYATWTVVRHELKCDKKKLKTDSGLTPKA